MEWSVWMLSNQYNIWGREFWTMSLVKNLIVWTWLIIIIIFIYLIQVCENWKVNTWKWVLICLITQMYRMIFTIYNVLKEKKQLYKQSEWFIWRKRMQVQECIIGWLCWLILDVNIKCELKSLFLILEKIATHTNVSMERKSLFFRSLFLCWVLF